MIMRANKQPDRREQIKKVLDGVNKFLSDWAFEQTEDSAYDWPADYGVDERIYTVVMAIMISACKGATTIGNTPEELHTMIHDAMDCAIADMEQQRDNRNKGGQSNELS